MRVPQPIPYQGSKRKIAQEILRFFPPSTSRIVEPFAGSAAISIAAAMGKRATNFWINDAHQPLITLWKEIIERPHLISERYGSVWEAQLGKERDYFNEIRCRFNESADPADFLYLLARCVKAGVRFNSKGEFNNSPDNRRKGARPEEMSWRIFTVSKLLKQRALLSSHDYKKVLRACTNEDLVYMDPPYQGVCGTKDNRYVGRFDHDEFCSSLDELVRRNVMFAVSYDGRTGSKFHGVRLPKTLDLTRVEICAGRSTQATLLGRSQTTFESLYISPSLLSYCEQTRCAVASSRELNPMENHKDLFCSIQT